MTMHWLTPGDNWFSWLRSRVTAVVYSAGFLGSLASLGDSSLGSLNTPQFAMHLGAVPWNLILAIGVIRNHRHARTAVLITVAVYAGFDLFSLITGESSCGCFGPVTISPAVTLMVNGLLGLAWISDRHVEQPCPPSAGWGWACILMAFGWLAFSPKAIPPIEKALNSVIHAAGHDPKQGHYVVIIYSDTCPHCRDSLPEWLLMAAADRQRQTDGTWVFLDQHAGVSTIWNIMDPDLLVGVIRISYTELNLQPIPQAWTIQDGAFTGPFYHPLDLQSVSDPPARP